MAGEAARFIEIYHSGMELLEAEIGRLAGGTCRARLRSCCTTPMASLSR